MKKYFTLIAALCLLMGAVSCQDNLSKGTFDGAFSISASIDVDATRVTYDNTTDPAVVSPSWTVGDQVFGFDNDGHTFTFEVTSIDENGVATLDPGTYDPADATRIHAIYYPGKGVSDLTEGTLPVDVSSQTGALDPDSPVLMCASADITSGGIAFHFTNQTAIIGVQKFQVAEGETVSALAIDGVKATGTFEVIDNVLTLTPSATTSTITSTFATPVVAPAGGIVETPVYIAALPTTDATLSLTAVAATNEYANISAIPQTTLASGNFYYMSKKMAPYVAQIGDVKYLSLDDAFTAANAGKTDCAITLLEDIAIDSAISHINNAGHITTLDLNGHEINATVSTPVFAESDLVINDSSVGGTGAITSTQGCAVCSDKTRLTINGGTFTATGYSSTGTILSRGTGSYLTINDGKIISTQEGGRSINTQNGEINGGTVQAVSYAVRLFSYVGEDGTLFVIDGENVVIYNNHSSNQTITTTGTTDVVEFKNGYVYAAGESGCIDNNGGIKVKGGYFNKRITPATDYQCIEVSPADEGPDGRNYGYQVTLSPYVAQIGATTYRSIYAAIAAANASETDCTIQLIDDITGVSTNLAPNNANGKTITIDFNDHTISGTAYFAPVGKCTFINSGANKIGGITNTSSYALYSSEENNTIMISGGRYIGNDKYGAVRLSGLNTAMTISGDAYILNSNANEGHAINVGLTANAPTAVLTINGGTIVSNTATALRNRYGVVNIHGGLFIGATNAIDAASANSTTIDGGYFSNGSSQSDIVMGNSLSGGISGGFFTKAVGAGYCAPGYTSSTVSPAEQYAGHSFDYAVVLNMSPSAAVITGGNTTNYNSFADAYAAAMQASEDVTIQLLDNCAITSPVDFNKAGTGRTVLDLNNHTLTASVSSDTVAINAKKELTITDNSVAHGGKLTSSTNAIIVSVNSTAKGPVTITNCEVSTSYTGGSYTNDSVVRIVTSKTAGGTLNIASGAKIIGYAQGVYDLRGTLNISGNAEITALRNYDGASGIYFYTGAKININSDETGSPSVKGYNAMRSGSANSDGKVTVNAGYFYASGSDGVILKASSGNDVRFFFYAGYYNKEVNNTLYPKATVNNPTTAITPVEHTHGGIALSYGYQIQ